MRSITTKLILAFLVVSLASLSVMALLARWNTSQEFNTFIFNRNRTQVVTVLEDYYHAQGSWQGLSPEFMMMNHSGLPMNMEMGHSLPMGLILTDTSGMIIIGGGNARPGDTLPAAQLAGGIPLSDNGSTVGYLLLGRNTFQSNPQELAFIQRTGRLLVFTSLGSALFALLLGILLAWSLTRPIQELIHATQTISRGSLGGQVPVRGRDELSRLAASFNNMSSDLERSTRARRQMTADIAHELRTPLSLIIGQAEAVHDGVLPASLENFEIIREEADRLEKLVEDLRTLSLADAGELSINRQPMQPGRLLEEVTSMFQRQLAQKDIRLDLDVKPGLPSLNVDPGRMTQVFTNILDNALRYTPQGGSLHLSAAQAPDGVTLSVTDSGPGLPEAELERIFDRLYRADPSRQHGNGGSGLGLAIARSIVELHGGHITARSQEGQGLTVQVWLPIPA